MVIKHKDLEMFLFQDKVMSDERLIAGSTLVEDTLEYLEPVLPEKVSPSLLFCAIVSVCVDIVQV